MKNALLGWGVAACCAVALVAQAKVNPTDPQPTCNMCPGTYIPLSELEAYTKKAIAGEADRPAGAGHRARQGARRHRHGLSRQARQAGAGLGRRARSGQRGLSHHLRHRPRSCSVRTSSTGSGVRRPCAPSSSSTGPGNNGSEIRNGVAHQIKAGDVVVIPAGTGHWFTKIDDHINYLMVRIDPDKVTPLKGEAQSKEYLSK